MNILVSLLATTLLAPCAQAQTYAERIRELESRVSAHDALIRSLAQRLDAMASQLASAPTSQPAPVAAKLAEITTTDGVTIKPRGRIQADALFANSGDGAAPTGTHLRRFQIGAEGKLGGGFRYSAEASYAGRKLALEDVLIAYQAETRDGILVGYFKLAITADDMTSDNFILFLERSGYANLFASGRRVGIGINHFGKNARGPSTSESVRDRCSEKGSAT